MTALRVGTRGSRLALAQTRLVVDGIRGSDPDADVEIVEVRTTGDRIVDVPLGPASGSSFFTKEIEDALVDVRIDLAVHSCKDLATVMHDKLSLAALLPREDPRDVLVDRRGRTFDDLPAGAVVGTSSVRRRAFLALVRPDLEMHDLRGNVPTRLTAVDTGRVDAVVLAAAGLERLGLAHRISEHLDPALVVPAAAQGAIAVQVRRGDVRTLQRIAPLDDAPTRAEVTAERACLRRLQAGCQAPVGCLARMMASGRLSLRAAVVGPDGRHDVELEGPAGEAEALGDRAASALLRALGVMSLREAGVWTGPPPPGSGTA